MSEFVRGGAHCSGIESSKSTLRRSDQCANLKILAKQVESNANENPIRQNVRDVTVERPLAILSAVFRSRHALRL